MWMSGQCDVGSMCKGRARVYGSAAILERCEERSMMKDVSADPGRHM